MPSSEANKFISDKILKIKSEGKPHDQAVAIAYSMGRKKGFELDEVKQPKRKKK